MAGLSRRRALLHARPAAGSDRRVVGAGSFVTGAWRASEVDLARNAAHLKGREDRDVNRISGRPKRSKS